MKFLIWLVLSLSFFASAAAQSPVAVEKEPRHRLRFSNQYVRVFDVLIPPGDTTLFHTHVHDGMGVRLSDARIREDVLGGASEDAPVKRGEVSFSYRPSPLTHSVGNIGSTPFRIIFIEVLPNEGPAPGASLALVAGQTLVLENERVRVSRVVLNPGQSIEMHEHAHRGLAVAVSDGRIAVEVPGEKVRTVKFKPGDTRWHEGGMKHAWRNAGAVLFEAVEIELK